MNEIKFHLPGLSFNYPINMLWVDLMKTKPEFFRDGLKIASFFGEFPTSLWNGGRFSNGIQCPKPMIKAVVEQINSLGIPIRYTFTNPLLVEEDLADEYCNYCMQVGDNGMNEVLVVSPVLEEYIRKTYPGYKINSSTCKEIKDIERLNEELQKGYYLVVLDQNLNRDIDFINQIADKDHIEILVNACCAPHCTRRAEHYRFIGVQQKLVMANRELLTGKDPKTILDEFPKEVYDRLPASIKEGKLVKDAKGRMIFPIPQWSCQAGDFNTPFTVQDNINYIPANEVWEKYVPLGFSNFKLEGRTGNMFSIVENYVTYMCKPQYRDEARYTMFTQLTGQGLVKTNRMWWVK